MPQFLSGELVQYLSNPDGMSREVRRGLLDDLRVLKEAKFAEVGDPDGWLRGEG